MPHWNRRERPDYRHLKDATPESALVTAIRSPTYGEARDYRLLAGFQARLTAMWGDREVLAIDELVPAHEEVRARDAGFFGHGRDWRGAFLHDAIGNLVGWGLRLAILVEEGTPEAQAFRMARRDPLFERMGNGQYRRLDAEGIREKSARGAGRREAARIRHAERVAHLIASHVGRLCEKGAAIPDVWFTRFPDEFGRLKGLAELVSDSRGTFVEAHRGMHLADQKAWLKAVEDYNQRHPMKAPPRDPAPVPAEDLDALDGL
ncbi:hypothetical protein ABID82_000575 [Methylobacterium sp. PvP062]|jgi:hypothetical protein|uniref:Uncharacterized protein n=1 Tax=Methylobacterium radiotolerans TaxID=31998 RepID=A0ABV2NI90_9HYPH|nr:MULTISPECIES: hypothetical protein [Methylobacterium]MCX7336095.1 hypothetical protein [Hyphomicrobiales bacterium]GAN50660.1 hypothetical protein ME121_4710 [Methylobacterium sp. ME121]KZC03117.1 hypothetical protein AU375_00556 [Methylobacterium radiotolerans]MBN6824191.1 hypothetical protein [Methylobacterium organophilum]MBP2497058.1 hypothetical protein [Methylobacterium sp. PvP105]